jgi:lactam utilization protein B
MTGYLLPTEMREVVNSASNKGFKVSAHPFGNDAKDTIGRVLKVNESTPSPN